MLDENQNQGNILKVETADQNKVVDKLLEKSRGTSVYYTLLFTSSFIVASGLLLDNAFITIGGILVAPVLTPILVIALGLAVGELEPIRKVFFLLAKSFFVIVVSAFLLAIAMGLPVSLEIFENTMRTAILYFIVAVASGVLATFALVRKEIMESLPGIAIAVSLLPPLSLIGIWVGAMDLAAARYYLLVFLFNFMGIMVGSLITFSLLKFYKAEKEVQVKTEELIEDQDVQGRV